MARVNEKHNVENLEKKLSQMEAKLSKNRGRFFSCFNCLFYLLIIILVLGGFITFWLAKSGLAQVPFLSNRYYTQPTPPYIVTSVAVSDVEALVQKIISQALAKLSGKNATIPEIALSEGQLSGILKSVIKNKKSDLDLVQLAIHDGVLDLYIRKNSGTVITMIARPKVVNGSLRFETESFKIGQASLPKILASTSLNLLLGVGVSTIEKSLAGVGELKSAEIRNNSLILIFN